MTNALSSRVLLILVLLGFLAGVPGLVGRQTSENGLRTTEILLDCDSLIDWQATLLASASTLTELGTAEKKASAEQAKAQMKARAENLPAELKAAGIESLAFGELHLDDLVDRGIASPLSYQEFDLALEGGGLGSRASTAYVEAKTFNFKKWIRDKVPGCYLLFADPEVARDMMKTLEITIGKGSEEPGKEASGVQLLLEDRVMFVPMSVRQLRLRSFGFDNAAIRAWATGTVGFKVWLRPEDRPGISRGQIEALFQLWKELPNVQGIIFGGPLNQAMGYPDNLETTRDAIKANGWKLGYIELPERAQQLGIETLVRELPDKTVRVMAVPPAQQQKLSPYRILGMYSLGASERNLRVLYVRPFANGKIQDDEEFLLGLRREVAPTGPADTFKPSPPPHLAATVVMSLGAGALALLLVQGLGFATGSAVTGILLALPVLGGVALSLLGKSVLYRTLLALCVSLGGPTLAFLHFVYPVVTGQEGKRTPLVEGLRLLGLTSLGSLLTGLWVAALLPDTTFLLGLDRFKGVKLLTLGVPVIVVLAFLWKRYDTKQWMEGLTASLRVYQAALVGVMLAAFGVLLLRTGNDAGATASDSERYLRVFLDQVLGVRPRFKEVLLAHPAMIVTPLLAWRLGFLPSLLTVLLAGIGQAGIVDTFAHVHTPLLITFTRVVLGVAFGVIFGLLGHAILSGILNRFTKRIPEDKAGSK